VTHDPDQVADLVLDRPPRLGSTRLVCLDGPAGSGKSTLAGLVVGALRDRGRSVVLVHLDDLLEGWTGLRTVGESARRLIIEPLAEGRSGEYRRYDWHARAYAESHAVPVCDVLVLEGVGSGHVGYAERVSLLVWVDAPKDVRLRRGRQRDGEALMPYWPQWLVDEERLHERQDTRGRADVVVDGVTGAVSLRE
jgi:uridine kinase